MSKVVQQGLRPAGLRLAMEPLSTGSGDTPGWYSYNEKRFQFGSEEGETAAFIHLLGQQHTPTPVGGQTFDEDQLYSTPFWVGRRTRLKRVYLPILNPVAGAGTATNVRVAFWRPDGNGLQPYVIRDSQTIAVYNGEDSAGANVAAFNLDLAAGLYFVSFIFDTDFFNDGRLVPALPDTEAANLGTIVDPFDVLTITSNTIRNVVGFKYARTFDDGMPADGATYPGNPLENAVFHDGSTYLPSLFAEFTAYGG